MIDLNVLKDQEFPVTFVARIISVVPDTHQNVTVIRFKWVNAVAFVGKMDEAFENPEQHFCGESRISNEVLESIAGGAGAVMKEIQSYIATTLEIGYRESLLVDAVMPEDA